MLWKIESDLITFCKCGTHGGYCASVNCEMRKNSYECTSNTCTRTFDECKNRRIMRFKQSGDKVQVDGSDQLVSIEPIPR